MELATILSGIKSIFIYDEPSGYEEYFAETSWKTFRLDEDIWNRRAFMRPGIAYYRELQVCYSQLLEEMSDSYLYDVGGIKEKFNEMHLRNCELERQLAIAEGNNKILQDQLDSALKWQSAQGRKNEVYASRGLELIKPNDILERDGTRFKSKSGATKQENMMACAAYFENEWELSDIAKDLGLSESSVRAYISTMQKHYEVRFMNGYRYICFDSEYGNNQWNLALYEKLSIKYSTESTDEAVGE